jgi:two-component system sensor histidine kinase PilS (NtrC family)
LLGNALRHSSGGQASVLLRVLPVIGNEERVELHVVDDGPGVPEVAREQVFEPFFTTHHQGTGLGLFIARELCVANGAVLELGPAGQGGYFIVQGRTGR